ncbi:MAG: hypothetical protein HYV26_05445, partial [Candidatus Hydrogenedentes bacterium]|nr:hypothetical protein [Candidatus Hydrogenedentota bacterium]
MDCHHYRSTAIHLLCLCYAFAYGPSAVGQRPEREVLDGISTSGNIPGAPYELAGKRIVFANWYYIQPGDLDWLNGEGKS